MIRSIRCVHKHLLIKFLCNDVSCLENEKKNNFNPSVSDTRGTNGVKDSLINELKSHQASQNSSNKLNVNIQEEQRRPNKSSINMGFDNEYKSVERKYDNNTSSQINYKSYSQATTLQRQDNIGQQILDETKNREAFYSA